MYFSNIKERHLYYVNFNDVRPSEFNANHLVVVLKKNTDNRTIIVMPLTSSDNGLGTTKVLLPTINSLPARLKANGTESYAVYNQVRTVNCSRFQPIYSDERDITTEVKIDDEVFVYLVEIGTNELEKNLKLDEKLFLSKKKLNKVATEKIINLAYQIKKEKEKSSAEIERIGTEIKDIIYTNVEYTFDYKEKQNGIDKIINDLLSK